MSKVVEITESNFETLVLGADKPVLIDFAAEWCGPCKRLTPVIEEIAEEYDGKAIVGHVDVDQAQSIARKFQIMSVPTLIVFNNGEPVNQQIGLVSKATLVDMIESA